MNDEQIETLLRKAPRPPVPEGLLEKLRADVALPRRKETTQANQTEARPLLRRWMPAISFAVIFVSCIMAIAVQTNQIIGLKHENKSLSTATQNLEQLRHEHAEYQKVLAEHQELEQLRKDFAEVQQLRAEVARLRAQLSEAEKVRAENQQLALAIQQRQQAHPSANDEFFDRNEDARAKAERTKCVNNLKQIGLAARVWATDHNGVFPPDFLSMSNELSSAKILVCPSDKGRPIATDWQHFSKVNVSYVFYNPNGSETEAQAVLACCPNHNNVVFSDGAVRQLGPNQRLVGMLDGKFYVDRDAEAIRRRYGFAPANPAAPSSNNPLNEEDLQRYQRLMLERYGLIQANTNNPPAK